MKTISELEAIRKQNLNRVNQDMSRSNIRITVGMATCGIAAGAKSVMDAIMNELDKLGLDNVEVVSTGCVGICKLEPVVEVIMPGMEKVTYVKMDEVKARRMVREHINGKRMIEEYIMHVVEGKVINDYVLL